MKMLIGIIGLLLLSALSPAQTPGMFSVTDSACVWTMPTDGDEVGRQFKNAPINWCDEIGIKRVSVKVTNDKEDGYKVKGDVWFANRGKPSQTIWVTFDLLDGEKIIAGSILRTTMEKLHDHALTAKDRESFEISAPVPLDYHITFRITLHRNAK